MCWVMAVIKSVTRCYSTENMNYDDVDLTMLRYITEPNKAINGWCFAFGVYLSSPEFMAQQFKIVRKVFHKETGRILRHFIVSYSPQDNMEAERAFRIAYNIALYYAGSYQIVLAVHQDTKNVHTHFIMNTVSYIDGRKFSEGPVEFAKFLDYVKKQMPELEFEVYDGDETD